MGFHEFSSPYDWSRIAAYKATAAEADGGMINLSVSPRPPTRRTRTATPSPSAAPTCATPSMHGSATCAAWIWAR